MRSLWLYATLCLGCVSADAQNALTTKEPEAISGRWEAALADGSFIGLQIELDAVVPGRPTTLRGVAEQEQAVLIGVFHRPRGQQVGPPGDIEFGFLWFSVSEQDTTHRVQMTWNGQRLQIYTPASALIHTPEIRLDLLFDVSKSTWSGLFQRGAFGGNVVLKRPRYSGYNSAFVGTWASRSSRCLHIGQAEDGLLTPWSDTIQLTGLMRYAPSVTPPSFTPERFGIAGTAVPLDAQTLQLDLTAYVAGVAGDQFGPIFVKLGADGKSLIEAGQSPVLQRTWQRQPLGTCLR